MSWTNKGKGSVSRDRKLLSDSTDLKMDQTKKDSFYDSGNTDSGILSGSNLVSDSCLSGEISPPHLDHDVGQSGGKTDSYKRLDSGVDVGLSDQLSELDIDDRLNDLSSEGGSKSSGYNHNVPAVHVTSDSSSWECFFKQDEEGDTSLHISVISNRYSDLLTLVKMIPDPKYLDIRNDMRQTALHLAVLTSQDKMVKLLVAAGARTDSVDHHGNTPLHLATAAGDLELVRELTQHPPMDRIENIGLKYKPNVLTPHAIAPEINMYNYEGLACVHLAVMGGHIALLKHLVWFGADIDAGELKGGLTAVHIACMQDNIGLVRTLIIELKADPCPLTYAGRSPYSLARENKAVFLATSLLELGSSCLGDSEDEDEEHINAHLYSDSEDDVQMVDNSLSAMKEYPLGVRA